MTVNIRVDGWMPYTDQGRISFGKKNLPSNSYVAFRTAT